MNRRSFVAGLGAVLAGGPLRAATKAKKWLVYVGTRAQGKGQGLYCFSMDAGTGACGPVSLVSDWLLPTALAQSADGQKMYAVSEVGNDGASNGNIGAFAVERPTGAVKPINQVSSGGGGPTELALDRTGRTLVVANYGTGSTTAFRVMADGKLGDQTASMKHTGSGPHRRQASPHAHGVTFSPDNRYVMVPDLGADRVFLYRFDAAAGSLTAAGAVSFGAGSGPRQVVLHPNGKFAYVMSELTAQVTAFAWDAVKGSLTEIAGVSALADGEKGAPSGSGMEMHPSGKFLYCGERTGNTLVQFALDARTGKLSAKGRVASGGKLPWACAVDPTGRFLAVVNQGSDSLNLFGVDAKTGALKATGQTVSVPAPVFVLFARG